MSWITVYFYFILQILGLYMANSSSARKSARQADSRRRHNQMQRTSYRTAVKTVKKAVQNIPSVVPVARVLSITCQRIPLKLFYDHLKDTLTLLSRKDVKNQKNHLKHAEKWSTSGQKMQKK